MPSPARSCTRCATARWRTLREVPFGRYYGSIDATPLFVLLLGRVLPAHRRSRDGALAVAERRGGARLDRSLRRPRRRRLRRISPPDQGGARQSGMEGFVRCDLPSRRPPGGRSDRAVRSAGLCVRRQAPCRACSPKRSGCTRACRSARRRRPRRCASSSKRSSGARSSSTYALALDGAKQPCRVRRLERRARCCSPASPRPSARSASRDAAVAGVLQRLGHSHRRRRRKRATTRCRITTARSGRTTTG